MYKAILFDFDGVLTTDATGTTSIVYYFENEIKIPRSVFETAYRKHNSDLLYGKAEHEVVWPIICNEMRQTVSIEKLYDSFVATPLDLNMFKLVRELKKLGYKTAMVTDNKTDRIERIVDHHDLSEDFDEIIISADIGSGKKHSEIFDLVTRRLGVNPCECIMIDNNADNLLVPNRQGMHGIFYDHDLRRFDLLIDELKHLGIELEV